MSNTMERVTRETSAIPAALEPYRSMDAAAFDHLQRRYDVAMELYQQLVQEHPDVLNVDFSREGDIEQQSKGYVALVRSINEVMTAKAQHDVAVEQARTTGDLFGIWYDVGLLVMKRSMRQYLQKNFALELSPDQWQAIDRGIGPIWYKQGRDPSFLEQYNSILQKQRGHAWQLGEGWVIAMQKQLFPLIDRIG